MELLFEHKSRGFWFLIIFIPVVIFIILTQAIKDYSIENQKIKIECSKTKDLCTIEKTYAPDGLNVFTMKRSDLKTVDKEYVSNGCFDIQFYYGENHSVYRLFGPKNCSTNLKNLSNILMKTSKYIVDNEDYLLIKTGEKFYLYWMDYLAPFVIILFIITIFILPKRYEVYVHKNAKTLTIQRFNLFNHPFIKLINLDIVEKFYPRYFNFDYLVICRFKDKKEKTLLNMPLERQSDVEDLCKTLNDAL